MSDATVHNPAAQSLVTPGPGVVAKAGTRYRVTHVVMAVVLLGYGLWSIGDGFLRYPQENEAARQRHLEKLPHAGWDIPFNQSIGVLFPPLGLLMAAWTLYNSRGAYRLSGSTLQVPGHPPVPLEAITQIDKGKWDRKGIVFIDYELPDGSGAGRIKLDDYVYDRGPTDEILSRIESQLLPPDEAATDSTDSGGDDFAGTDATGESQPDAIRDDGTAA